jgi:hypothetical protein
MLCSDKDSITGDTMHIDTHARFQVVEVDEPVLHDKIDDPVFLGYLHGYREIIGGLWWEIYIDSFFHEWWVRGAVINFHDMQLVSIG